MAINDIYDQTIHWITITKANNYTNSKCTNRQLTLFIKSSLIEIKIDTKQVMFEQWYL